MRLSFAIDAKDVSDTEVYARVTINTQGLTQDEARHLKAVAADRVMQALVGLPYFHPHLSEMKVRR